VAPRIVFNASFLERPCRGQRNRGTNSQLSNFGILRPKVRASDAIRMKFPASSASMSPFTAFPHLRWESRATIGDRLPNSRPSVISEGTTAPTRIHTMIELQTARNLHPPRSKWKYGFQAVTWPNPMAQNRPTFGWALADLNHRSPGVPRPCRADSDRYEPGALNQTKLRALTSAYPGPTL
jgi:hypothetical protein